VGRTVAAITASAAGVAGTSRWEFNGTLAAGPTGPVTFNVQIVP